MTRADDAARAGGHPRVSAHSSRARRYLAAAGFLFAVALSVASCGGSPEDGCRHYWAAVCERVAACDPHDFVLAWGANVDACAEHLGRLCPTYAALPDANFAGDLVSQCADEISKQSCDAFEGAFTPTCLAANRGSLEGGVGCVSDLQCQSGYCIRPKNAAGLFACGHCATLVAEGDNCAGNDRVCDAGLYCAKGTCTKFKLLGDPCTSFAECDVGVTCVGGVCAPPLASGSPCSSDDDCDLANAEVCSLDDNTCTPAPISYWGGGCAFPSGSFDFTYCPEGFYCTADPSKLKGRCLPVKPEGDSCASDYFSPCDYPAECGVDGTCQLPVVAGCPQ